MAAVPSSADTAGAARVDFQIDPASYKHWRVSIEGAIATLTLDVDEAGGLRQGYALKLNSYDLGVDIELHDAIQRLRFERPEVRCVVLASGKSRVFCSGANIFMLGQSSHAWKVNFCKFTNETRNGIEDASAFSGLKFIAACNGTTAGGGYELALACDEIVLIDDRSSAVSLPELPLLGVLPGTGGLTRLTDKRKVRRDHADVFCTLAEGVRGKRAVDWRLVDAVVKPQQFAEYVRTRAQLLAARSDRPERAQGVALPRLDRTIDEQGYHYRYVDAQVDRAARRVSLTVRAPAARGPQSEAEILATGAAWWPLQMARELEDAILSLRTNELAAGLWVLRTRGDGGVVLDFDDVLLSCSGHWFVRETIGLLRRTFARLEVSPRSLIALIEPGSCFAGTLLELALAADRSYMRSSDQEPAAISLSRMNFGPLPAVYGQARLSARFYGDERSIEAARAQSGERLDAAAADSLGLVTATPDPLDWDDEIRIMLEERASLSPDALTGLEANLRFGQNETMQARIFGRLTAWQNWIFSRPNAIGPAGALKVFGTGRKAQFDWERV